MSGLELRRVFGGASKLGTGTNSKLVLKRLLLALASAGGGGGAGCCHGGTAGSDLPDVGDARRALEVAGRERFDVGDAWIVAGVASDACGGGGAG